MSRIVKDPEERKYELVDAAETLFMEKGYSKTSIRDIVEKVGVAHGLFYYYFDSKSDLINAIVERMFKKMDKILIDLRSNQELNAQEKLLLYFDKVSEMKKGKEYLIGFVEDEEGMLFYHELLNRIIDKTTPHLTEIIKQGIEEGVFDTDYPEEAVRFILTGRGNVRIPKNVENIDELKTSLMASGDIIERVLGAEEGSIKSLFEEKWDDFEDNIKTMYEEGKI